MPCLIYTIQQCTRRLGCPEGRKTKGHRASFLAKAVHTARHQQLARGLFRVQIKGETLCAL